jgi:GT2 family glycosyltransferase
MDKAAMTFDDAPDVSIMIVAYNSAALIADCLAAIPQACRRYRYETLLIDNGDGSTAALVAAQFPWVRIVPSQGNIGFARGNNVLARKARAPFLLLLNPDMVACPDAIDRLIDGALAHPEAGAWGGVTLDKRGQPDTGNTIAIPSLIELASRAMGKSLASLRPILGIDTDAEVDVLSGGFVMFSRAAWDAAGGLDERFFLYCEEVDLFVRLRQQRYRFWRIAGARGYHAIGHGEPYSPTRLLYWSAGTMEFVRRHWSRPRAAIAGALIWIAAIERYLMGRLLGGLRPRLRQMSEGYRHVALRPWLWFSGYHPQHGLLAKLATTPGLTSPPDPSPSHPTGKDGGP